MENFFEILSEPLVGSIIGIVGIIIGAFFEIFFYFKSKIVSKPRYSIENINLINLLDENIPNDVTISYDNKTISCLNKTIINIWNAGKKTIMRSDLYPQYIEIPFKREILNDTQILSVVVDSKCKYSNIDEPIVGKDNIKIGFDFLEYKDKITITIIHTYFECPKKINGHVVGNPKGFINISELYKEFSKVSTEILLDTPMEIAVTLLKMFISYYK